MTHNLADEKLWFVSGPPGVPGWGALQAAGQREELFVLHFDPGKWALVKAVERPEGYQGLTIREPPDGLYLDNFGRPCYVAGGREVHSARAVVRQLGQEAEQLLERIGDADMVLDRLGRAY